MLSNISRVLKCAKASDAGDALAALMLDFGVQAIDVASAVVAKRKVDAASGREWKLAVQLAAGELGDDLEFMQHEYNLPQFAMPTPASAQVVAPTHPSAQASAASEAAKKAVEKAKGSGWFKKPQG